MKKYISLFVLGNTFQLLLGTAFDDDNGECFGDGGRNVFAEKEVLSDGLTEATVPEELSAAVSQAPCPVFSNDESPFYGKIAYDTKSWMGQCEEVLNSKPFCKIVLPGAHDAGAYGLNRKSKVVTLPEWLEKIRKAISWLPGDGIISRWSNTQKLTIEGQLNAGIRYFDLRVCQCEDEKFYLYHGLRGPNLEPVFQTFHNFLRDQKGEILILDMSNFRNVKHEELLKLIKKYLVEFCATKTENNNFVTYGELVKQNKRCFIYYDKADPTEQNAFLLGSRDAHWANKTEIEDLKTDLKKYHSEHKHNFPWVLQYVLTPNEGYVLKHPFGSVEDLAEITHKHMDEVLRDFPQCFPLNVVMFDFVDESLCRKIIDVNF